MRVWQKKEVLKMIKLLNEAHIVFREEILKKSYDAGLRLLQDCQLSAEKVGTMIDAIEGEGTASVGYLEEYCEVLYQISQHLGEEDAYRQFKQLEKSLKRAKNSLINEITSDKVKILFLPYKASMWDSLESIWLAAQKDDGSECQVVPIPYYERKRDGSFGEMHDEGCKFPDYVPVISWKEYQLSKEHPDIIYFHNPYDQYNYVTSVAPEFYSENLRENSGLLVYVPYFINGGDISKSFYEFPSYYYADYMIAQSEEDKQFYKEDIREKIIPLGSPKFDKIVNYKMDQSTIPIEWINRTSGKKVVFLNTSISLILQYGEFAIEKIKKLSSYFSGREDCILLWRPHPLLNETLDSMRPDLLPYYENLLENMRRMPNVIIDLTADVTRAVKMCDAYIGEESSSIVHLFGVEGKPVFLLNMKVRNIGGSVENEIPVFDAVLVSDTLWYVAGDRNLLGTMKKDGTPGESYQIPGEALDGFRLYNSMVLANNCLYLVPYFAKEIAIFDLEKRKFKKIKFENPVQRNFVKGYRYRNQIFMVPAFYGAILQLNCEDGNLTYHYKAVEVMKKTEREEKEPFCFNGACVEQEELLMAGAGSNAVYSFNMQSGTIQKYEVGVKGDNYWGMAGSDGIYFLASNRGRKITRWDKNEQISENVELPEGFQGDDRCFYCMVAGKKDIYVFPKTGNSIITIDRETGKTQIADFDLTYLEGERKSDAFSWSSNYYFAKAIDDETMLAMSAYDNSCVYFHGQNKIPEKFHIRASKEEITKEMGTLFGRKGKNLPYAMRESSVFSVKEFADYVCSNLHQKGEQINAYRVVSRNLDGTCGAKIHKYMMEVLEI